MTAILGFIHFILQSLLTLMLWAIVISAILSWLVAFDVVNLRNRFAASIVGFLDAVTRPVLAPVQRIIPPLGGVDISPIVVILLIVGIRDYLLGGLFEFLLRLVA